MVFGETSVAAVLKDIKQLHNRMLINPKNTHDMSKDHKKRALQYLIFLKQKRCINMKGRRFVDKRNQRKYLTKDDTSAPKVSTEALLLMLLIDAMGYQ